MKYEVTIIFGYPHEINKILQDYQSDRWLIAGEMSFTQHNEVRIPMKRELL